VSRDFTFEAYAELLDVLDRFGYEPLTVRSYLRRADVGLPERFVVVRHDVDRKVENALRMARLETAHGVATTYYFRMPATFEPALVRRVAALGHEVGYHYEDLDETDGDVTAARRRFAENLRRFRSVSDVDTVCMHGNPLTPHDNRDMWTGPDDFAAHDLLGEAYLSMDFEDVTYFSDTGRTWRDGPLKVKDHTLGEGDKTVAAEATGDLVDLFASGAVDRACLLVHPDRWADTYPELLVNQLRDGAVNVVKRGLAYRP
jgi:hypothetical protein